MLFLKQPFPCGHRPSGVCKGSELMLRGPDLEDIIWPSENIKVPLRS